MGAALENTSGTNQRLQEKYEAWARLPAIEPAHFRHRNKAWNEYCDVRDGLDAGTSEKRSEARLPLDPEHQAGLMARRYRS